MESFSMQPLKVFIGHDHAEEVAYHVCAHSIFRRASVPVAISQLRTTQLHNRGVYWRERDPRQSNDFSFSRFLVPYLCDYQGYALFMDCDMLVRTDISELFDLVRKMEMGEPRPVYCVQHDYTPSTKTKFLGHVQYKYPRKNWSSVMMFNCAMATELTPKYVNEASAADLHRMAWADRSGLPGPGGLPVEWNHLVGEYEPNPHAKIAHFTIGTPCFHEYAGCEFSDEWFDEMHDMRSCMQLPVPTVQRNSEK
jgi:hypothetical protein